jgi:starch phosphorylase
MSPTKISAKSTSKGTAKSTAKKKTKNVLTAQERYVGLRTSLDPEVIARAFEDNLFYLQGRTPQLATINDYYMAAAYTIRDRMLQRWFNTIEPLIKRKETKVVAYLSAEFLLGPHMGNNLINLDIYDQTKDGAKKSGRMGQLDDLLAQEPEPGLGNGGLGRLAACYMESLASLEIPAIGYGIRYEYGIFKQEIRDGWQVEHTDKWLTLGNPWEISRPELACEVKFGGHTEGCQDSEGCHRTRWVADRAVKGIPYDTPILGYKVNTCDILRLWKSEAVESFDFQAFNIGDYYGAVDEKIVSENLTKVLYPNDEPVQGKQLRLEQQYFFVSCSLQDMIRIHLFKHKDLTNFHEQFAIQLNDTHPSVGVAELMRLLVDEYELEWDEAWHITTNTFAYTNHTLLPEALEKWPVALFAALLPRHLEIIYEINRRFLDEVRERFPGDNDRLARLSIIDESGERYIRMAHLASVGSHAINGVAALHTELLKEHVLRDFHELWPEKLRNKTNGVTPRRWIVLSNPRQTELITSKIGDGWIKNLDELKKLEKFAVDTKFQQQWHKVQQGNKQDLATYIKDNLGISVDPDSMFDILVKRLHEYKRQHLNVLHIITLYNRIKKNPGIEITPRTFIFGGKAAPSYFMAKLIIKLINSVGDVVNNDPDVDGRLKVVFVPNFSVSLGQRIYPAADLSEQISLAGMEASGTGNMKFSMNGALTIGTLDGANIEIREEVGAGNFFLFGLAADQVRDLKSKGYNPREYHDSNEHLQEVMGQIASGHFSQGDAKLFMPLVDSLLNHDDYMLFADYQPYIDCQDQVSKAFLDQANWTRMSILNVARMGKFSSDRSIREYCEDIWKVKPLKIDLRK